MNGLYFTPECAPFASAGGVGLVPRHLLPELAKLGLNVPVVMPRHGCILPKYVPETPEFEFEVHFGGRKEGVRAFHSHLPNTTVGVWFLENATYFSGQHVYAYDAVPFESDVRRYSFFAKACLELIRRLDPDIVHVNDWPGGYLLGWMELANREADSNGRQRPFRQRRLLTIHNIAYQGQTWKSRLAETDFRDLAEHSEIGLLFDDLRYPDCVNPLRLAMELADKVNAVSPANSDEIQQPENRDAYFLGGCGLEAVSRRLALEGRLTGILNGQPYLGRPNDAEFEKLLESKREKRAVLSRYFANPHGFLIGFVGRAVEQKVKLLAEILDGRPALEHILDIPNVNVLMLGTGEPKYEDFLISLSIERYSNDRSYADLLASTRRKNFATIIAHDAEMGRRIQLGSDVFLMPSRDESCGIAQFESMAAATPVVANAVGGLKNTVLPHTEPNGTGFTFHGTSREDVLSGCVAAVREAARVFRDEPDRFRTLQRNAYWARFPWSDSARRYHDDMYMLASRSPNVVQGNYCGVR